MEKALDDKENALAVFLNTEGSFHNTRTDNEDSVGEYVIDG